MKKEATPLTCLFFGEVECDCSQVGENARQMNELGRNRGLINAIQHEGFDRVNAGLINALMVDGEGSYYTDAFEDQFEFHPGMLAIRAHLAKIRLHLLIALEDPDNIQCTQLKSQIEEQGLDPKEYLDYLRQF